MPISSPFSRRLVGSVLLASSAGFFWTGPASACQDATETPDRAPVRSVVLFNSGAGQFTHAAKVSGKSSLMLPVPVARTDDLLKSLAFSDNSGGRVNGVRYRTSRDQLDQDADELRYPLTLAQFLQSQRGQLVSFGAAADAVTGRILGVENRTKGGELFETLVVVADNGIQSRPVSELDGLKFVDPAVAAQLSSGLEGLARDDSSAVNQIEIEFAGEGERDVRFSYVVDTPVWKMSWRLAIEESKGSLQGWAHVDNDTGLDWNDIQLELRSGRPFLFSAAVFEPVIAQRPDLGIRVFEIPRDTAMLLSGSATQGKSGLGGGFGGGGLGGGSFGGASGGNVTQDDFNALTNLIQSTVRNDSYELSFEPNLSLVVENTQEVLDVNTAFVEIARTAITSQTIVLAVKEPVSIAAGYSSMVPVFRAESEAREKTCLAMSLADFESATTLRPTRAFELPGIETTQLIAGPVAIFREGVFAGDCILRRPVAGQPLVLEFGRNVDLLIQSRAMEQGAEVVAARRENQKNIVTRRVSRKVRMTLQNVGKDACNLDLEIGGVGDWTCTGEGLRQEGDKLHGDLELAPGASRGQAISLVRELASEASVSGVAGLWAASKATLELDESLKALVLEFNSLSDSIGRLLSESNALDSALQSQIKEQSRLTSQLAAAGTETELGKLLAGRILAGEQAITEQRDRISELTAERRSLEEKRAALENQ